MPKRNYDNQNGNLEKTKNAFRMTHQIERVMKRK